METVRERVQREAPGVYSKDLIEQIFRQPYCKIQFLERAGMGTRQTCAKYLRERSAWAFCRARRWAVRWFSSTGHCLTC